MSNGGDLTPPPCTSRGDALLKFQGNTNSHAGKTPRAENVPQVAKIFVAVANLTHSMVSLIENEQGSRADLYLNLRVQTSAFA